MITHVAGMTSNGRRWKISLSDAIAGIRDGTWTFYVHSGAETLTVEVAPGEAGKSYLKTNKDGADPTSLLSLPECWPQSTMLDSAPEDPGPVGDPEGGHP
jgi:hypothetical protein